jgi:hypothetical protein
MRGKIKVLPLFTLMLGIGAALSNPAIASGTPTSPPMTNYIQNARTPADHKHIASLFELQAVRAQSIADSYAADQFTCRHSQATALQRRGERFADVRAHGHCRKMLRQYTNDARELRGLADYHRRVAEHWRAATL